MTTPGEFQNHVKARRRERGWTQAELAERAGISRTAITAIEGRRLVPSVAAALSLARAFACTVEELFGEGVSRPGAIEWAWPAQHDPSRFWHAQIGGQTLLYPVEATAAGEMGHDGVVRGGRRRERSLAAPNETLVVACCDPAAGLLAAEYTRKTLFRMIVLPRSSQQALDLLASGLVHAAGLHLSSADEPGGNAAIVRQRLGEGFRLLRMARWQEGLALGAGVSVRSVRSVLRSKLRWVGRESGSGARQCLDELLGGLRPPRYLANDHRGVAGAIRCGWADVGVCLQLTSHEAGLRFLPVREEAYDLCFRRSLENDPRWRALMNVVRAPKFRRLVGELPGYDSRLTGEVQ